MSDLTFTYVAGPLPKKSLNEAGKLKSWLSKEAFQSPHPSTDSIQENI